MLRLRLHKASHTISSINEQTYATIFVKAGAFFAFAETCHTGLRKRDALLSINYGFYHEWVVDRMINRSLYDIVLLFCCMLKTLAFVVFTGKKNFRDCKVNESAVCEFQITDRILTRILPPHTQPWLFKNAI